MENWINSKNNAVVVIVKKQNSVQHFLQVYFSNYTCPFVHIGTPLIKSYSPCFLIF